MPLGFVANTYLHLAAATVVTAISAEYPISQSPLWLLGNVIASFVLFFVLLWMTPGPLKYIVFTAYLILLGQSLSRLADQLQQKDLLKEVLASVLGIFAGMTAIGLWAGDRVLGFGPYLFAGLIGLIIGRLGLFLAGIGDLVKADTLRSTSQILSWVGTGLFSVYIAYDTADLQRRAKYVRGKPDYIDSSLALFLDIINLFSSVGDIASD